MILLLRSDVTVREDVFHDETCVREVTQVTLRQPKAQTSTLEQMSVKDLLSAVDDSLSTWTEINMGESVKEHKMRSRFRR